MKVSKVLTKVRELGLGIIAFPYFISYYGSNRARGFGVKKSIDRAWHGYG